MFEAKKHCLSDRERAGGEIGPRQGAGGGCRHIVCSFIPRRPNLTERRPLMPATATAPTSLAGQTLRWKFEDSPTGKGTYEHTFDADGSVSFSMLDGETKGEKKGKPTRVKKYAAFAV